MGGPGARSSHRRKAPLETVPDAVCPRRTTTRNSRRHTRSLLTFRTSGHAFGLNFPGGAMTESGERVVGRLGNVQQGEDLALQIGEFGVEQLHGTAGLRQSMALGEAEQA